LRIGTVLIAFGIGLVALGCFFEEARKSCALGCAGGISPYQFIFLPMIIVGLFFITIGILRARAMI
jgi:uncharacterized membrane protein YidH (DUF202 family)